VGKISDYDKIAVENLKTRKDGGYINFYFNLHFAIQ